MKINPLLATDAYKVSHKDQYHPLTELIFSNFTPRFDKYFQHYSSNKQRGVVVAGMQGVIQSFVVELWNEGFFNRPKDEVVEEYRNFLISMFLADQNTRLAHIADLHDLGYLPLEIRSLKEGSLVKIGTPVYTVHNTDKRFAWLTNYFESGLSAETWKVITIATTSFQYLKLCHEFANQTCDDILHIPFQCHDFSARGLSGLADGYKNAFGHLLSFTGSDSLLAVTYANQYYGMKGKFVAASVPASEHSVATTNIGFAVGRLMGENPEMCLDDARFLAEVEFILRYITEIYPAGIVSYVMDSYNYFRILREGLSLAHVKSAILAREGKFVVRPDSGIPEHIIAGYRSFGEFDNYYDAEVAYYKSSEDFEVVKIAGVWHTIEADYDQDSFEFCENLELTDDEVKGSIEVLWEIFGGTVNKKGYKVLDEHIGLIYGDSITVKRTQDIFTRLKEKGFASSNVVLGVGSMSFNLSTRDTFGFACKATGSIIDGQEVLVSKDPKTDSSKKSARGFIKVVKDKNNEFQLVDDLNFNEINDEDNELVVFFRNGKTFNLETLERIRERLQSNII